jgi:flagellin-like hook-associated protein FlgL
VQKRLTNSNNASTQLGTALTTQMSNLTNANLATTLTKLQQTQTSYEAALESGVLIMQLSLLDFLT